MTEIQQKFSEMMRKDPEECIRLAGLTLVHVFDLQKKSETDADTLSLTMAMGEKEYYITVKEK